MTNLTPLFALPAARFRIEFTASGHARKLPTEAGLRGKLGFHLRRKCCPFPDFRRRSCDGCALARNCLYLTLFSPMPGPPVRFPDGSLRQALSPLRPFVIELDGPGKDIPLKPGAPGTAIFTLFGPAIAHCALFLEAAVSGIASFSAAATGIGIMTPEFPGDESETGLAQGDLAWPLSEWAGISGHCDALTRGQDLGDVRVRMVTPLRLVRSQKLVREGLSFALIINAVIRRLRDLRRCFMDDNDMGAADRAFFEAADAVGIAEDGICWARRKRYSFPQKQNVCLSGFGGEMGFRGVPGLFLSLLKAGEIVHIGKGTSSGNGRFQVLHS